MLNGETHTEEFDTVLFAVGRAPHTNIGLAKIGVKLDKEGFIVVNDQEQTSLEHIYAIGDVIASKWKITNAEYVIRLLLTM